MSTTVCASLREIPAGYLLADCAVSGGTLQSCLQAALTAAEGRLCLRLRPVYMDFPLPCPSGCGISLTPETLRALYDGSPCHFSESLCAEYFTCLREGQAHVAMFDTLRSLQAKYLTAAACGVPLVLIEDGALRAQLKTG